MELLRPFKSSFVVVEHKWLLANLSHKCALSTVAAVTGINIGSFITFVHSVKISLTLFPKISYVREGATSGFCKNCLHKRTSCVKVLVFGKGVQH